MPSISGEQELWGTETKKAVENFPVSGEPIPVSVARWLGRIKAAAARGGEKVWQMPLFDEYKDTLKSDIADMINSPGRPGGAVTAAMFLKEFAGTGAWAHLDIAGTAWADEPKAWTPRGATGAMIRTLVEVGRAAIPR